jgi:hypothetical protein
VKRRSLLLSLGTAFFFWSLPAHAGSYLDRASLLVTSTDEELSYLRRKHTDIELARLIHEIALARLEAAKQMSVPPEVILAHPHLLMMLENAERAAFSAAEKRQEHFMKHLRLQREETELFRSILRHLGWDLPRRD